MNYALFAGNQYYPNGEWTILRDDIPASSKHVRKRLTSRMIGTKLLTLHHLAWLKNVTKNKELQIL